jgi:hypothetical protein
MPEMEDQLKSLQEKLQLLVKRYHALQKENLSFKQEIEAQSIALKNKDLLIQQLQEKADVKNIGLDSVHLTDKKKLEQRINAYLNDIEKCLALLNS